mgnify:CR=1 FL=1
MNGHKLAWRDLYPQGQPGKISLPSYPFAKESYWHKPVALTGAAQADTQHPLLQKNISSLDYLGYAAKAGEKTVFSQSQPLQTSLACLEMARAALSQALKRGNGEQLELSGQVWGEALAQADNQVAIVLRSEQENGAGYEIYSQGESGQETILCQGQGRFLALKAPEALPLADFIQEHNRVPSARGSLYRKDNAVLVSLPVAANPGYVLQPSQLQAAIEASLALLAEQARGLLLNHLDSIRVYSQAEPAYAKVSLRQQQDSSVLLDIDLLDRQGYTCSRLTGLQYQIQALAKKSEQAHKQVLTQVVREPVAKAQLQIEEHKPRKLNLPVSGKTQISLAAISPLNQAKPSQIQLIRPEELIEADKDTLAKPSTVRLGEVVPASEPGSEPLQVFEQEPGIYAIELKDGAELNQDMVQPLLQMPGLLLQGLGGADGQLRRRRGRGGAQIGDKVTDNYIDFMPNCTDHRNPAIKNGAGNTFFIKCPQVFQ